MSIRLYMLFLPMLVPSRLPERLELKPQSVSSPGIPHSKYFPVWVLAPGADEYSGLSLFHYYHHNKPRRLLNAELTDDEASDSTAKRICSPLHFDYPSLSPMTSLIFSTKAFWEGFHSSEARAFAKLICCIRSLAVTNPVATRSTSVTGTSAPRVDVTLALAGLNCILTTLTDFPDEYSISCVSNGLWVG
ncbi:hypothetical protein B0H14DRAFT_3540742 [Mycena olivaceomarginata]|nr:hypothetical protein B0H14DRAFT_3540742 [Mycena olivaceomarginata]